MEWTLEEIWRASMKHAAAMLEAEAKGYAAGGVPQQVTLANAKRLLNFPLPKPQK